MRDLVLKVIHRSFYLQSVVDVCIPFICLRCNQELSSLPSCSSAPTLTPTWWLTWLTSAVWWQLEPFPRPSNTLTWSRPPRTNPSEGPGKSMRNAGGIWRELLHWCDRNIGAQSHRHQTLLMRTVSFFLLFFVFSLWNTRNWFFFLCGANCFKTRWFVHSVVLVFFFQGWPYFLPQGPPL